MPAVRIAQADSDTGQTHQDILTCGVCQKPFALGDINKFIQHKVHACNKENYALEQNSQESPDNDDTGCGGIPLAVVNTRRPSISAPIKKGINATGRLTCSSPLQMDEEARCSTPKPRTPNSSISPTPIKDELDDHHENCTDDDELKPRRIKQELDSTNSSPDLLSKKNRAEVADAESNTTHSEPSYYICSTCKQRLHSAWRLVQHCQNSHGIKIYLESSSSAGSSPSAANCAAPAKNTNSNHHSSSSSSSSCSRFSASSSSNCSGNSSSGVGVGVGGSSVPGVGGSAGSLAASSLPLPSASISSRLPLLPPTSTSMVDPRNPFGVGGLLRMPLGDPTRHHQFASSLGGLHGGSGGGGNGANSPVFARPSSSHQDNHFRMEQIVSEQFRLNPHHSMGLAAAAAAVAASAAAGIPPPHSPYPPPVERPPSNSMHTNGPRSMIPPPPSLSLPLEPQLDFYSQRLRQLAGTTSPGVANGPNSLSPRKLTPPFTSPGNSQPLPASRSSSTDNSANDSLDLSSNALKSEQACNDEKAADFSVNHHHHHHDKQGAAADNELKYKCEFCPKRFKFQSNLVTHRRAHTREKPFKCTLCDHACTQSSKLKRHMKIHKNQARGNGLTGGEAGVTSTNGDGSTTSTPEQISNDGSDDERIDDDDEEVVAEEEDEEVDEDEEEDDEDEEEDEEEDMELDEEGDEDDDGDAPEDLTTKSTSSTPPTNNTAEENSKSMQSPQPTPSQTPLDKTPSDKVSSSGSLVSELMDKFGLSSNQLYSEAYKQALQESSHNPHIRKKDDAMLEPVAPDNNNVNKMPPAPVLENGMKMKSSAAAAAAALKLKEDFAANLMASQPPLDILGASHGFFGTGMPFENLLDVATSKRMKLDMDGRHNPLLGRGNLPPEADGIYPGLWLPGLAAAHQRDIFGRNDVPLDMYKPRSKSNSENRHGNHHHKSHNSSLAAAAAAAMNLRLPNQHLKKESRRNDTCEFCGKVFKNCSNLTVHRRSHTGEKPYKCELCSYACAQSSKLTRHMKTHGRMGKDVYRCRFCEMPFSVPSTLEKHMRKCVVSQNIKDNGPLMPSMLIKCEDDSSISSSKDNT